MQKLYIIILLCASFILNAQQDPQYSQYMFNHVVINPGYAGSKHALSGTAVIRNQWAGISGAPKTLSLSVHGPLKNKHLGLGGHLIAETIGPKAWTASYADFAYKMKVGKGYLALGLSAGLVSYKYNFGKLNYADNTELPADQNEMNKNSTKFDGSFGIYYHSKNTFAGYSTTHLTRPKLYNITSTDSAATSVLNFNLARHHFLTFGHGFSLNDNLVFSPSIILKTAGFKRGDNLDINLNFLINEKVWIGASIRSSKTLVVLTQFSIKEKLKIGYAYDLGFSKFTRNKGSHEIMLGYIFGKETSPIISPRYL